MKALKIYEIDEIKDKVVGPRYFAEIISSNHINLASHNPIDMLKNKLKPETLSLLFKLYGENINNGYSGHPTLDETEATYAILISYVHDNHHDLPLDKVIDVTSPSDLEQKDRIIELINTFGYKAGLTSDYIKKKLKSYGEDISYVPIDFKEMQMGTDEEPVWK